MPRPIKNEDKKSFISRYMSSSEAKSKFSDQKQRLAVAYSIWKNQCKNKKMNEERVHNESRFEEYLSKAYEESAMAHSYRMDELASEKYKLMREFGIKTKEAAQRFLNAMGLEKELVNKIIELFTK